MNRRNFIITTSLGSLGLIKPQVGLATQLPEGPVFMPCDCDVTVQPEKDGTSIYGPGKNALYNKLAKASFAAMGGAYGALGGIALAAGTASAGAAVADPELMGTVLFGGAALTFGGMMIVAGSMATLLGYLASDPPRNNYRVDACSGRLLQLSAKGALSNSAIQRAFNLGNELAGEWYRLWELGELFQGAYNDANQKWVNQHHKSWMLTFTKIKSLSFAFLDAFEAAMLEFLKDQKLADALATGSKKHAGGKFSDTELYRRSRKEFLINKCMNSQIPNLMSDIGRTKIQPVSRSSIEVEVANLRKGILMLDQL